MGANHSRKWKVVFLLFGVSFCIAAVRGAEPSIQTSRYEFLPDESTIVQSGGIAGVHWTYAIDGSFCLIVDNEAGVARFDRVDTNAVDKSEPIRTLDPNTVFNLEDLTGSIVDEATIAFTGRTAIRVVELTVIFENDGVSLTGTAFEPWCDGFFFEIDAATSHKYAGGTGDPSAPYRIATAKHMNAIGTNPNDWDKHFQLIADIDLAAYQGTEFNIIGYRHSWTAKEPYRGTFDGNGHIISNFSYSAMNTESGGLFGYIAGDGAEVRNVGLTDPNVIVDGGSYVGSLVGHLRHGTVRGCWVQGGSISAQRMVGGLVGVSDGAIVSCHATTRITGDSYIGGLTGYTAGCLANCYSASEVAGEWRVGGLTGENYSGIIANCYAAGPVNGALEVGGLVGYDSGSVLSSFWDIETTGQAKSAAGTGMTTAEMQMPDTFSLWGACDNGGTWTIDEGNDYPRLGWEDQPGQPIESMRLADLIAGNGTEETPFLIYTAEELNFIGLFPCEWGKYFSLMADVDLAASAVSGFNSIGYYGLWGYERPFTGVFEGNGWTISNLSLHHQDAFPPGGLSNVGMFGYVADPNAEIRNVKLVDPNVDVPTAWNVGALVGWLAEGTVDNCAVEGGVVSGKTFVGGLLGQIGSHDTDMSVACIAVSDSSSNTRVIGIDVVGGLAGGCLGGTVTRCSADANVSGDFTVGGLLGCNKKGSATECYSNGHVAGVRGVGGLFGSTGICNCFCISSSVTMDCYSTAIVEGNSYVGGLVGYHAGSWLERCYSIGEVTGEERVGGLIGAGGVKGGSRSGIEACFWDTQTSGNNASVGGTGLTTSEMQSAITFLKAGWDFVGEGENGVEDIWWIDEGQDYPRLWWETGEKIKR